VVNKYQKKKYPLLISSIAKNLKVKGQLNEKAYGLVKQEFRTYAIRAFIPIFLYFLAILTTGNNDAEKILAVIKILLPVYLFIMLFAWHKLKYNVLIATYGKDGVGKYVQILRPIRKSGEFVTGKAFIIFCNYPTKKKQLKGSTYILGKYLPHGQEYSNFITLRDRMFSKEPRWDELTLSLNEGDEIQIKYLEQKPSLFLPDIGTVMETYNLKRY